MQVLKLYMDLQVYMQVFYMPCNKACLDGLVGKVCKIMSHEIKEQICIKKKLFSTTLL